MQQNGFCLRPAVGSGVLSKVQTEPDVESVPEFLLADFGEFSFDAVFG